MKKNEKVEREENSPKAPSPKPVKKEAGPCLPGFDMPVESETPPPVAKPIAREATPVIARMPPIPKRSGPSFVRTAGSFVAGFAVVAAVAGGAAGAVYRLMNPRVVVEEVVREVPDGIPLAVLPDSADPELWPIVSSMTGKINNIDLQFRHGLACTNGVEYKVCLDFCRRGKIIYVRIVGDKTWVACLDEQGHIKKVYPAPKTSKPLKEIF